MLLRFNYNVCLFVWRLFWFFAALWFFRFDSFAFDTHSRHIHKYSHKHFSFLDNIFRTFANNVRHSVAYGMELMRFAFAPCHSDGIFVFIVSVWESTTNTCISFPLPIAWTISRDKLNIKRALQCNRINFYSRKLENKLRSMGCNWTFRAVIQFLLAFITNVIISDKTASWINYKWIFGRSLYDKRFHLIHVDVSIPKFLSASEFPLSSQCFAVFESRNTRLFFK